MVLPYVDRCCTSIHYARMVWMMHPMQELKNKVFYNENEEEMNYM